MLRLLVAVLVPVALMLAACGQAVGGPYSTRASAVTAPTGVVTLTPKTEGASRPATSPATVTAQALPTKTAVQGVLIQVVRSGGLVGLTQTFVVYDDGTAKIYTGSNQDRLLARFRVPASQLAELRSLIQSSAWKSLGGRYGQAMPDAYEYAITAGGKAVTTYDGVKNPSVLDSVLRKVTQLAATAPKS